MLRNLPCARLFVLGATIVVGFAIASPCVATLQAQNVAVTEPLTAEEQLKKFHLPPGFEVQLVASEPAIHKPMNLNFDSRGRLYVTDTVEYPYPVKGDQRGRDTLKVLTIREQDGHADQVATLVDGLNIPLGVTPAPGGTLVYSIPSICRYTDADGDGRAEQRQELYGTFAFDDTHGMTNSFTRWLDGWVYACHGFRNTSTVQGSDGQAITMNSGNTYRMRVDGSHVEQHTWGQVNPFGLAFDPLGNLYSADCHTLPIYQLLRGAYYPSFGKADDGLGFAPVMMSHNHGSTGIGGVAYYAAEQFPPEYRDTIFIGNVVTGKVNHDRLEAHGSTYKAIEQPDFMTCDDPWFHPVNLLVGPDGALYVADFYNRIIGHYEVPLNHPGRDRQRGRIWRVVYTGRGVEQAPATEPPRGPEAIDRAPCDKLLALLGHGNLTVRTLATHELVDRVGPPALEPLKTLLTSDDSSAWQRVHGLWALERLEPISDPLARQLAGDRDRAVRIHLLKALAERAQWTSATSELVRARLSDSDAFVRRAAADGLARHPSADNVRPLLALWSATAADDTHLIHTARMALRDQLRGPDAHTSLDRDLLADPSARIRLADVSRGVPSPTAAEFLFMCLRDDAKLPERAATLHQVVRYISAERLPDVYAFALALETQSPQERRQFVREIRKGAQERGSELPAQIKTWSTDVARQLLSSTTETDVQAGLELVREVPGLPLFEECVRLADSQCKFGGLRSAALEACVAIDGARSVPLLAGALHDGGAPLNVRQQAATLLAKLNNDATRKILAGELAAAPAGLAVTLATGLAQSPQGAETLLSAIEAGKASALLLQERGVVERVRNAKIPEIERRIEALTAKLPPRDERVKQLIDARRKLLAQTQPDARQGQAVFKKNCANCHRIGDDGNRIGPSLDGVGVRGVDRLLEDVLDPNRNVDQAFRTTQIVTTAGTIVSGLVLREEGEIVVLADAQGKEVRIPAAEIDQKSVSSLSLMPGNLAQSIPEAEFVQLVSYLLSQRQAPADAKSSAAAAQ
jgi:putative heme-binding domain-containing protein